MTAPTDMRARAEAWLKAEALNFTGDPYAENLTDLLTAVRAEALEEAAKHLDDAAPLYEGVGLRSHWSPGGLVCREEAIHIRALARDTGKTK